MRKSSSLLLILVLFSFSFARGESFLTPFLEKGRSYVKQFSEEHFKQVQEVSKEGEKDWYLSSPFSVGLYFGSSHGLFSPVIEWKKFERKFFSIGLGVSLLKEKTNIFSFIRQTFFFKSVWPYFGAGVLADVFTKSGELQLYPMVGVEYIHLQSPYEGFSLFMELRTPLSFEVPHFQFTLSAGAKFYF